MKKAHSVQRRISRSRTAVQRQAHAAPNVVRDRQYVVAANWKMNLTVPDATLLAEKYSAMDVPRSVTTVVCPSFTALIPVRDKIAGTGLNLGAQDVFWETLGAYTGEVSADELLSIGCRYVIIGHSERRRESGETDQIVNRKVFTALGHHLSPILCVGESLEERSMRHHLFTVMRQVQRGLHNVPPPRKGQELVIAYEPIWAISPGGPATPHDAHEMAHMIQHALVDLFGERIVRESTRVLYGGNVTPDNVGTFVDGEFVHGVLVGKDSLKVELFSAILNALKR
ncbi:MAG: triose-phosphate isomerase [Candidatus Kerfeldbacteria bacterium]